MGPRLRLEKNPPQAGLETLGQQASANLPGPPKDMQLLPAYRKKVTLISTKSGPGHMFYDRFFLNSNCFMKTGCIQVQNNIGHQGTVVQN